MSDTANETQWYIAREGQQHGPLTDPELQLFVTGGHLKPTDLIWRPGFTDWLAAQTVFPPKSPVEEDGASKTATESDGGDSASGSLKTDAKTADTPASTVSPKTMNLSARMSAKSDALNPSATTKDSDARSTAASPTSESPVSTDAATTGIGASAGLVGQGAQNSLRDGAEAGSQNTSASSGPKVATSAAPTLASGAPFQKTGSASAVDQRSASQNSSLPGGGFGGDAPNTGPRGRAATGVSGLGPPPGGSGFNTARIITSLAAVAFVGGGAYFGYANRVELSNIAVAMFPSASGKTSVEPPVVQAEKSSKTATRSPVPQPAARSELSPQGDATSPGADEAPKTEVATAPVAETEPQVVLASLDSQFQKSVLWSLLKAEYPQWYKARLQQVISLNAAGDDPEVTKRLLSEIVALRRKHSDEALAASTDKLREVAAAFLSNLKRLAEHSPDVCSTFISDGELSPTVLDLMSQKNFGPTLEVQTTAIFHAISDGRTSPVKRERAGKEDYGVLTRQLSKLGWTQQDFQLFANQNALTSAPSSKRCQMLQDWFSAHIAIADTGVQDRLLVDTLRHVVAE